MRTLFISLIAFCLNAVSFAGTLPSVIEGILVKEKCTIPVGTELQDPIYALGVAPKLNRNESVAYLCIKGDKTELRVYISEKNASSFKCPLMVDQQNNTKFGLRVTNELFDGSYFVDMKSGKKLAEKQTKGPIILMALGDDSVEYRYSCVNGSWYVMFLH